MKLKNKVALITGSSRGIGKAIALLFAKEGAKIIVNYNKSKDEAIGVVKKIESLGSQAIAIKCDVSKEKEIIKMVSDSIKEFKKIDILVNNAGIVFDIPLFEKTVEQWNKTLNTNLVGPFLCSKYVSKHMKSNSSGNIINISSSNGIDSFCPDSADYDASKAGINLLTKNMAQELGPKIRVNAIAPGWVDTDINKDLPKDFVKEETDKIVLGKFANPDEIAQVALFLASEDSSFITGNILMVDGGYK